MRFTPAHPTRWLGVAAIMTALVAALGTPAAAIPAEAQILHAGGPTAVADSYIVVFKDTAVGKADVAKTARDLAGRHGGTVARTYQHALRGFEARMPEAAAKRLAANPNVKYVEQNHTVRAEWWGEDRIDQRALPLNQSVTPPMSGYGVKAYVIDSGIRTTHIEFAGRLHTGIDLVDGGTADDCNGHGTHNAGIIGGETGVAKSVILIPVRVLDCTGSGTVSRTIAGVEWVTGNHNAFEPAVANMSLSAAFSQSLNAAVANSIADDYGITYVVAAGNNTGDACNRSPASLPAAITVGATTRTDARAYYSNYGTCVDLFAPGSDVKSAWNLDDLSYANKSGTSMAAAHVTGAVSAVHGRSNMHGTPQQVHDYLVTNATNGVVTDPGTGSPNKLLYLSCVYTNDTDVPIPDNTTVESAITVPNCDPWAIPFDAWASPRSTVAVNISHTYIGDLVVSLIAPDGTPYTLHNQTGGDTDNINATYTVNLSNEITDGTWKLRVQDANVSGDVGYIDSWNLDLTAPAPAGTPRAGSNLDNVDIPDNTTAGVESAITIANCSGNAVTNTSVLVNIVHTWIGDLVVSLIAPDGTPYTLHNQTGGDTDNINATYTVDLSSEVANGTWKLRVQDLADQDVGYIDNWYLII